jgi:LCP family protein required for cell wall assembly
MNPKSPLKTKAKKRKYIILIIITLAIILTGTTSLFVVAHSYVSKVNYVPVDEYDIAEVSTVIEADMEESNPNLQESTTKEVKNLETQIDANIANNNSTSNVDETEKKVKNILLIGSDSRQGGATGRSDTMILLSINENTKKIIATSFLRDIYLQIPGLSQKNRLNAAYSYGGAGLLIDTIEENFKVEIDNYVAIDFYSFMNVVDAVGGVTLTVSEDEIKVMNNYINELNKLLNQPIEEDKLLSSDAGSIHLNGKQALAYSRVRYVGNADFERTSRQRMVLIAVYKNVKSQNFSKLNDLLNIILPEISTDLTESELLGFIKNAASYKNYDIEEWSIPYENKHTNLVINGMQVLGIDFDENKEQLQRKIDVMNRE